MKKIAFSGASGNGISPLEQIMALKGYTVYGSDYSFDIGKDKDRKKALIDVGINIVPQDGSAITDDLEFLCISAAVKDSNPDIKKAREKNIPIKYRSDLLKDIFSSYNKGIAVGGTAGKTTTTAMIGYVLEKLNKKPCMINGGALCNFQDRKGIPNYIYNEGDICVIEADESDGSITKYNSFVGIVNNISHDHTSMEKLMEYFTAFVNNSKNVVINYDCPNASKIKHPSLKTFSTKSSEADFYAYDIKATPSGMKYKFMGKTFQLQMLGAFNVSNALATITACSFLGVDPLECAKTLEGFLGIKTRLEKIGEKNNIIIYNDFAHNPSKIRASLEALKDYSGRVIAMYQPHTPFSAVNTGSEMAEEIAKVLDDNDIMILQEIYELTADDIGITSNNIVKDIINNGHKNALFLPTKDDTKNFITNNVKSGDRIIIMGAHDNSLADFCKELLEVI
ncbi:MAG: hypothetical protein IKA30_02260 [Alphaproteobacteria bacterium]|nr:hypothetical protein [Alphaproteobacteria bacterium]